VRLIADSFFLLLPPSAWFTRKKTRAQAFVMQIQHYKDLIVWQKAMDLAEQIYLLSHSFPREELYGLTSQIRRAAVSVPSNIAEGHARQSTAEFKNFLSIALGSLAEVDTQQILAQRLLYIDSGRALRAEGLITEVRKMLHALAAKLS
jgi:four helix bundle protein